MTRTVLANRTVLVVRENPATPLAAVVTSVSTGSGSDTPVARATALAAVEAERPGGSVAARIAAVGGSIETTTDGDGVTFTSIVDGPGAGAVIEAHALLLGDLHVTAAGARDVDAGSADDAKAALERVVRRRGEGAPGIGAAEPIAAPDVDAFHAAAYRADRTTIVVAGNVTPFSVMREVQVVFGAYESPAETILPPVQPPPSPEPAADGRTFSYQYTRADSGIAYATVAFPLGRLSDADAPAAELLAAALAVGRSSRLGRALQSTGIALSVDGLCVWGARESSLVVQVGLDPRRVDAGEAALFREIDRLRRERVSDAELQRTRNMLELRMLTSRDAIEGEAASLMRFEAAFHTPGARGEFLERLRAVSAEDVRSVAARLLDVDRAAVDEVLPLDAPERTFTAKSFAETITSWAPGLAGDVTPASVRSADPVSAVAEGQPRRSREESSDAVLLPVPVTVKDFSTLNGPKAFVREDQSLPLLAFGFYFPAGRVAEPADARGVTELMLRSMLCGSQKRPGGKLLGDLEQLGAVVRVVADPDFFGFTVNVVSRNADLVMPIVIDAIEHPVFAKEDVARERDVMLLAQRADRANAVDRSVELFWQNRFPAHAYGVPRLGLPETVGKLTDEKVKAWYAQTIATQFPLVGIVGDTDGSSLVARHLVDVFDRPDGNPMPSPVLPPPMVTSETAEATSRSVTVQTAGFPCPGAKWAALDALDVAAAAADATVERRRLGGALYATAASAPSDESRTRDALIARMARVASADLTDAELGAARARAVVANARSTQTFAGLLRAYVYAAATATPLDTVETYGERVAAIAAGDVRRTAAAVVVAATSGRGIVRGRQ